MRIDLLHTASLLVLSLVLVASGLLKLRDLDATAIATAEFGIRQAWARPLASALAMCEVSLGALLVLGSGALLTLVTAATAGLLVGLTLAVVLTLARHRRPSCQCFGALSSEPISVWTAVRNCGLVAMATLACGGSWRDSDLADGVSRFGPSGVAVSLATVVLLSMIVLLVAELVTLRRAVASGVAAADHPDRVADTSPSGDHSDVPGVVVLDEHDVVADLAERCLQRAHLVIAVALGCPACHELAPALSHWRTALADEVDVVLLLSGSTRDAHDWGEVPVWRDPDGSAFATLGIGGTPAALVLGTDGRVAAGPALGSDEIVDLLHAVIQAIGVNVMSGRAQQTRGPREIGGRDQGEAFLPAPGYRLGDVPVSINGDLHARSTLSAALRELAGPASADVAIVAWSSTCRYCLEVAAPIQEYSARGDVVLVVAEPAANVRAAGMTGPIVEVDTGDAATLLGVPGTPAGYPVRLSDLVVQSGGGVGGGSVLRMLRDRQVKVGGRNTLTA